MSPESHDVSAEFATVLECACVLLCLVYPYYNSFSQPTPSDPPIGTCKPARACKVFGPRRVPRLGWLKGDCAATVDLLRCS